MGRSRYRSCWGTRTAKGRWGGGQGHRYSCCLCIVSVHLHVEKIKFEKRRKEEYIGKKKEKLFNIPFSKFMKSGNLDYYRHLSALYLCQTNGGLLEAHEERSWRYYQVEDMRPLRSRRQYNTIHKLDTKTAWAFIWAWSNQSLGTSLALKLFDGGNLIKELKVRRFVPVCSCVYTIKT